MQVELVMRTQVKKSVFGRRSLLAMGVAAALGAAPVSATLVDTLLPFTPATTLAGVAIPAALQQAGDLTGLSVATDGITLVVGAPQAAGGNANSFGVVAGAPGKVYVYQRDAVGSWIQKATLMASGGGNGDSFGSSVAVDGNTIVIGADGAKGIGATQSAKQGRVYVFEKPINGWSNASVINETAELLPVVAGIPLDISGAYFGHAVDIQGGTIVVGQWGGASPAVYIFERPVNPVDPTQLGSWGGAGLPPVHNQVAMLQPDFMTPLAPVVSPLVVIPPNAFGFSVAIDAGVVVVGGDVVQAGGGAIYLFEQPLLGWAILGQSTPTPAVAKLGLTLQRDNLDGGARSFGFDVDIKGDVVVASAMRFDDALLGLNSNAGAVFVFEKPGTGWPSIAPITEVNMLTALAPKAHESFGRSVSVTDNRIIVGSFTNPTGISDPLIGVGLPGKAAAPVVGSAYIFDKPLGVGASWSTYNSFTNPAEIWQAPSGSALPDDMFGYSVAAANTTYVAGGFGLDNNLVVTNAVNAIDVGSAVVKEATVDLVITNTLPVVTDLVTLALTNPLTQLIYTITVANNDPIDTATNVTVGDQLPTGLSLVSATPSQGAVCIDLATNAEPIANTPAVNLSCNLGSLSPNSQATITIVADVTDPAAIAHTATVGASETLINSNPGAPSGVNTPPVANAGAAQTVDEGATVTLNGSASSDIETLSANLTYVWTQTSGDAVPLTNGNSVAPSFTAPTLNANSALNANSELPLVFMLTVTDTSGDSTTATVDVKVKDITLPTITAPDDKNIEATGINTTVVLGNATATDAVTTAPIVSNNAQSSFPLGPTKVTWVAQDAAGNQSSDVQLVTVRDTTAPIITTPVEVTVEATGVNTNVVVGAPSTSDLFPVTLSTPPATFPVGDTVVTWTATDANDQVSTAFQTITVKDTLAPTLTLTGGDTLIQVGDIFNAPSASATDLVSGTVAVTDNRATSLNTVVGIHKITFTAVDGAGNTVTKVHTVVVNGLPVINGVPTATVVAGQSYSYSLNATDANNDTLSYSLLSVPAWLTFDSVTGVLSGSPAVDDIDLHENITITVSDGNGGSASVGPFNVEVTAVPAATGGGGGGGGGSLPLSLLAMLLGLGLRRRATK